MEEEEIANVPRKLLPSGSQATCVLSPVVSTWCRVQRESGIYSLMCAFFFKNKMKKEANKDSKAKVSTNTQKQQPLPAASGGLFASLFAGSFVAKVCEIGALYELPLLREQN